MERVIARGTEYKEEAVEQIARDTFRVQSFVEDGVFYETTLENCTCGAHIHGPGCVKHRVLVGAVSNIPVGMGADVAIERTVDLCHRLFSKSETSHVEAYRLYLEVMSFRYATEAMVAASRLRLRRAGELEHGLEVA